MEKEAQSYGYLTEVLSGQQFMPETMLSGAVIVIFVVNDEVLAKDSTRKMSLVEQYLFEEAEIRIHEGAYNGHRLNIVYTEEGRRRRGFLRVKVSIYFLYDWFLVCCDWK